MKTATWNDLLVDLKLREIADSDFSFLYKLLKGRNPKENISHKEISSYKQHVKFVKSKPYQKWYIIEKNRKKIGAIYFSKQNEIGIHFLPKTSSESIKQTAMQKLIKKNPTQELKEDLRVYKAFRSGGFNGYATATEWLMKKSDEIQQVSKEDEKVNDLSNKKVFKFSE